MTKTTWIELVEEVAAQQGIATALSTQHMRQIHGLIEAQTTASSGWSHDAWFAARAEALRRLPIEIASDEKLERRIRWFVPSALVLAALTVVAPGYGVSGWWLVWIWLAFIFGTLGVVVSSVMESNDATAADKRWVKVTFAVAIAVCCAMPWMMSALEGAWAQLGNFLGVFSFAGLALSLLAALAVVGTRGNR